MLEILLAIRRVFVRNVPREMTRLLGLASPRNCQQARDLSQGYREATANAGVMEPPRDTGRPLLSLQEVESRLVFAKCKPFTLAMPGRQWCVLKKCRKDQNETMVTIVRCSEVSSL